MCIDIYSKSICIHTHIYVSIVSGIYNHLCVTQEELQLFGNNISGQVPNSLSNLVNLKLLSLGEYTGAYIHTLLTITANL